MFTGIIEEIGEVKSIQKSHNSIDICVLCKNVLSDLKIGDSVSVNGVCLTASKIEPDYFLANVMPETVNKTTLAFLKKGSKVNLERALKAIDRLGGHIVTGHIDGLGVISSMKKDENSLWIEVTARPEILSYIVYKGSIAIDGTSLTVAEVKDNTFNFALIPHTRQMSIIGYKKVDDYLNIECDILGKYIEKFLGAKNAPETKLTTKNSLNMDFLRKNGFV